MMNSEFDFAVIGGGMAGSAIAAHLAKDHSVILLEAEHQPGYHSTGRSAALYIESYGNAAVRALTRASRDAFYSPSPEFTSIGLVKTRQLLITASRGRGEALEAFRQTMEPDDEAEFKSPEEAAALFPILETDQIEGAIFSRRPADIEVHELQQGYLRMLKRRGGVLSVNSRVVDAKPERGGWSLTLPGGKGVRAGVVVNAAGAWAGELGKRCGAADIRLKPLKRTAFLVDAPQGMQTENWPLVADVDDSFYIKPDAGMLLISPFDETPSEPGDAQPDELDIAIAVDRVERSTTLQVRRISHKWAGLRSFVSDTSPVVGYDPVVPGFFWLAALGGFGIQTAPALGRVAACLAARRPIDADLLDFGIDPAAISPARPALSLQTVR